MTPARVVEEIAGERGTPVFQNPHQGAALDLWRDVRLKGKRQTQTLDRGSNHEVRVVDNQGPVHVDDEGLTLLLELPAVRSSGTSAQVDARVRRQIVW